MIRHTLAEGWLLIRQRTLVSAILTLALAVPICVAGIAMMVGQWLEPLIGLAEEQAVVAVLLHPHMDPGERSQWLEREGQQHPEWSLSVVPPEQLAERLARWFPYLEDLFEGDGGAFLPPLVEITTSEIDSIDGLEDSPEVIAVGPRSSVNRLVGSAARDLGWILGLFSFVLLTAAAALAAIWVHLEIYRHGNEITIMRLIGATEGAIRGPFLLAVAVPGIGAAALSTLGTLAAVGVLSRLVVAVGLPELEVSGWVLTLEIVIGCLLPVAAAGFTLARHAHLELEG